MTYPHNGTIRERLDSILVFYSRLPLDNVQTRPESTRLSDLGLDSLEFVEIVLSIEDRFKIQIPDQDVDNLENPSIQQLISLITDKLTKNQINCNGDGI
jgi:acyl carrier protein